jgi:hypothetical protein
MSSCTLRFSSRSTSELEHRDDCANLPAAGEYSYDASGLAEAVATPQERAATLFRALDRHNLGVLTKQEFMEGYMQRSANG